MKFNLLVAGLLWLALQGHGFAQTPALSPTGERLSLDQCVTAALQNSLLLRQAQLQLESGTLQLTQARQDRLPTLSLFGSQALSAGRNINPSTNQFIEQQVTSNNYQVGASVTVFNGFALQNAIRQADLFRQAGVQGVQGARYLVTLTVIQNYLTVLTNQEQLEITRRQVGVTRAQADRTRKIVAAGVLAEGNLFDLEAQLANDELAVVNARNTLDLSKLTLLQTMNLPASTDLVNFTVEPLPLTDPTIESSEILAGPNAARPVYDAALQRMPDVKAAELRVRSDALGVKVARASTYPSLTLNGGLSTLYSSVGLQRFVPDGTLVERTSDGYVTVGGVQQPVYNSSPGGAYLNYNYFEQLRNNLNRSVSLNLRIPIINGFQARNRITTAIIQQKTSEVAADNVRLLLRQQVEQAAASLRAAANRYQATTGQVRALERAFTTAESRFNAGTLNSADYVLAKNNLDRARTNLVQVRYDYALSTQILNIYRNGL
ncbi:MAG: TolC family protein [Cytophagaceae bacterium]|nr:TolC family protein [Cytophagaceae bacterium]